MKGFRNLKVWQKSHKIALSVYAVTKEFPSEERFGLTSQLRRAALSIPTNIAEGAGRKSEKEFAQFLNIAMGSSNEVDYLLEFSQDLELINEKQRFDLSVPLEEIKSMLYVLISRKTSKT